MRINFYSPILDDVDIKFYKDYANNKDDFILLSKNKTKQLGDPAFTAFVTLPNNFKVKSPRSAIEILYDNPDQILLNDAIEANKNRSDTVSGKITHIPIIILATIVGMMVIFVVILIVQELIISNKKRF